MKRVLLTGASGFIGYHCLKYFLENTNWFVVCLDSFRHKGRYSRLAELKLDPNRVSVLRHDLSVPIDESLENRILDKRIDPTGESSIWLPILRLKDRSATQELVGEITVS